MSQDRDHHATASAIASALAAQLTDFDRAAERLRAAQAGEAAPASLRSGRRVAGGSMAHQLSWWCEVATALSVVADRGGTIDLDNSGGRYGDPQRSLHSARNAARTAAWLCQAATRRARGIVVEPGTLAEIHHSVLSNVLDPNRVGRFRKRDVSIVDHRSGSIVAKGTAPGELPNALDAWSRAFKPEAMAGIHPLVRSGLAHLELARIHPFPDGNGRTARVLIAGMHAEDGLPALPFPIEFERHRGAYLAEITDSLIADDPRRYLRWHVGAMREAIETAYDLDRKLAALTGRMSQALICDQIPRETAASLAAALVTQPIATTPDIAERAGADERTTREALWRLEQQHFNTKHCRLGDLSFFTCFDSLGEVALQFARESERSTARISSSLDGVTQPAAAPARHRMADGHSSSAGEPQSGTVSREAVSREPGAREPVARKATPAPAR